MSRDRRKTILVVIEPDPLRRAEIAEELDALKPLQILFFESSRHARAFLAAVPVEPGVRVEVAQRGMIEGAQHLH